MLSVSHHVSAQFDVDVVEYCAGARRLLLPSARVPPPPPSSRPPVPSLLLASAVQVSVWLCGFNPSPRGLSQPPTQ
eukprot:14549767-Alexandrium_andersonii.AAC.1